METTAGPTRHNAFMVIPAQGQAYSATSCLSRLPPLRRGGLEGSPSQGHALSLCCILLVTNTVTTAATPSATKIVSHCYYKQEFITWKRLNAAWVWDTAVMYNVRTKVSATYQMQETEVNVNLDDRLFSERQLRRGYPAL